MPALTAGRTYAAVVVVEIPLAVWRTTCFQFKETKITAKLVRLRTTTEFIFSQQLLNHNADIFGKPAEDERRPTGDSYASI